ncbi:hypothetical protein GCM10018793_45630 [Streptomyces sulfonofaciens]|uniref:Uncharacterized protein n=1 Tax=Streptomyces sulfonofaciens TaxID=68272 RepID=A0A919L4S2_9ACTN|nr:hypothetical protein [Streptomyces sulfonofaciens]GHH83469.1 hypothetical protein GCM10018793_45630 [Streptomyces sulfonofaciens]
MNLREAMTRYRTLVVEGPEGLSRTGLLGELGRNGFVIRHASGALPHVDPTQPFRELLAGPGRIAVDGGIIHELVYGPLRHGRSRVTWIQALDFAEAVAERDGALLHVVEPCTADPFLPVEPGRPAGGTRALGAVGAAGLDEAVDEEAADAGAAFDRAFRTLEQHAPVVRVHPMDPAGQVRAPGPARRRAQRAWHGTQLTVG